MIPRLLAGLLLAACSSSPKHVSHGAANPRRSASDGAVSLEAGAIEGDGAAADAAASDREDAARAADAVATPLCDGDDRMEFAAVTWAGGGEPGGDALADRNGMPGLFIDGHCRYYATEAAATHGFESPALAEVHTGLVDDATRDALATELHYSEWAILGLHADRAQNSPDASFLYDAGNAMLTDGTRLINCYADCMDGHWNSLDSVAMALLSAANRWTLDLYAAGTPMTGDVRIFIMPGPNGPRQEPVHPAHWPLAKPIADFVTHNDPSTGFDLYNYFTIGGADAQNLRALRTAQIGGAFSTWWTDQGGVSLPVSESPDGPIYDLAVSDLLPYEDDRGPGQYPRLHMWNVLFPPHP